MVSPVRDGASNIPSSPACLDEGGVGTESKAAEEKDEAQHDRGHPHGTRQHRHRRAAQLIDGAPRRARAPNDEDGQTRHNRRHKHRSQERRGDGHLRDVQRSVGNADVERLNVGAPQRLAEPFQEEGEADGGHEQDDLLLVDHVSEDHPLDGEGEGQHDETGEDDGEQQRHASLHQADQ
jgi:hypothetical protein